jgi:hypothetical protein
MAATSILYAFGAASAWPGRRAVDLRDESLL